jgi:predicted Zn-dependent peptidase
MYMNQQDFAVDINVLRKHFGVYHAIGLRQDIENADYEAFIDFIRASFKVPYDVLLVTDYSAESQMLADSIDKRFDHFDKSDLDYTEVNRVTPNPFYVPEFYGSTSTETTIMDWMQIEGIDRWKSKLIAELWSRGMSPLFKEIRESRGLSYCPLIFDLNQSIGGIQTFVKTAPENVDMVRSVIADMFSYRWQEFITPERVKAVKDSLMCSHLMLSKDNTQINHTITHSLYGTPIKPSIEMIDSVSYDEIWDIHDRIISKTRFVEASGGQGVIV